jgi:hypothetical protein
MSCRHRAPLERNEGDPFWLRGHDSYDGEVRA